MRGADVPKGIRLNFDLWHEKEEGYLLPKVWVSLWPKEISTRIF